MIILKKRRRRLVDNIFKAHSYIGAGATIIGNIRCDGDIVMAASVDGDIKVGGTFTQVKTSRWVGKVEATNAVVAGQVHGNVIVAEKLEVRKSASIRGSVRARTIAVAEGAVIEGEMAVTSSTPVIHFEEKRREN